MPLKRILFALPFAACLALAACGSCPDEHGIRYTCNCTATCNGQPVSSYSTPCADNASAAEGQADDACHAELGQCPGVMCSCACTSTGESCPIRECREAP